ncbi:MAG TPA: winged helix DNA-binding protein [Sphingomonadaceae bacterium]|nr:winged helix DNA-binding protein [Sphingomonadaceae bacterium]
MNSEFDAPSYPAHGAVLVVGDSSDAMARGAAAVAAADLPLAGRASLADAERLLSGLQPLARLFVEIGGPLDAGDADRLDRVLSILNSQADRGQVAAVVSTPLALVDAVAARLLHPRLLQLADAGDAERGSALVAAMRPTSTTVRDSAGGEAARLRYLTDEVGRIAAALARLSGAALTPDIAGDLPASEAADSADSAEIARIVRARGLRGRHFDPALFADPAWDMLLDLAGARIGGKPVAVSSLCIAAAVPATTALRWIRMLTDAGLFVRNADPHDGRRVFIDLSDAAAAAMRAYLAALRAPAPQAALSIPSSASLR